MTDINYTLPNGFTNDINDRLTKYLAVVRANSGDPQPPMARRTSVMQTYASGKIGLKEAVNIHDDAVEDDYIVTWVDPDGQEWIGLTKDGFRQLPDQRLYTKADIDALREICETEANRETPIQAIIQWANQWLSHIQSLSSGTTG